MGRDDYNNRDERRSRLLADRVHREEIIVLRKILHRDQHLELRVHPLDRVLDHDHHRGLLVDQLYDHQLREEGVGDKKKKSPTVLLQCGDFIFCHPSHRYLIRAQTFGLRLLGFHNFNKRHVSLLTK